MSTVCGLHRKRRSAVPVAAEAVSHIDWNVSTGRNGRSGPVEVSGPVEIAERWEFRMCRVRI
jgi:hypothetical protein